MVEYIKVIIKFKSERAAANNKEFVESLNATVTDSINAINAVIAIVPKDKLGTVKQNPDVEYVEVDHEAHILGFLSPPVTLQQTVPWGISKIRAIDVHQTGNKGSGIKACVIDTGIDYNHSDLKDNYKGGYNFINSTNNPMDDNGHGCASPDTRIYTTFCGLNKIEEFYNRIESSEIATDIGTTKTISKDIYTLSYADNKLSKHKVTAVHKVPVKENIVRVNDILLTPWHKCFVFNKNTWVIEEKRADEVKVGEYLISPGYLTDLNSEYRTVNNFTVNEDFAYIIGVISGDGYVNANNKRIELNISSPDVMKKCKDICNKLELKVTEGEYLEKNHCYRIIIYNESLTHYVYENIKTLAYDVKVPEIITKSPKGVIIAYLAGLTDTDGYVDKDKKNHVRISSASKELIDSLYNVLSILGLTPYKSVLKPSKSDKESYQIGFVTGSITEELKSNMVYAKRRNSIINDISGSRKNIIPIKENQLYKYLKTKYGIEFDKNHYCTCCGKVRLSTGSRQSSKGISKHKLKETFEALNYTNDPLYNLANNFNFTEVANISRENYDENFYDLTVENSNNYVAGISDMVFIHNTHVSGTIAALDNGEGVVGVAPEAGLYALKVLDNNGSGSYSNIISAIQWAIDNKMQIINMSFGGTSYSKALEDICNAANDANILLIAAAGNSGSGSDTIIYPAKFDSVVSVGATDSSDVRASFSSTGPDLEICAPGVNIISTVPRGTCAHCDPSGYKSLNGTSMACPHVVGTAALVLKSNPNLTNTEVRARLTNNSIDLGPKGRDVEYGYGRVDAKAAVDDKTPPPPQEKAYKCSGGPNYVCEEVPVGTPGSYPTLQECQNNCKSPIPPAQRYRCTGAPFFRCVPDMNGPFAKLEDCQAACKPAPVESKFDVQTFGLPTNPTGILVMKNTSGQYTAEGACTFVCEALKKIK